MSFSSWVLVGGTGYTGRVLARRLKVRRLLVTSRTLEKAEQFAAEVGAEARGIDLVTETSRAPADSVVVCFAPPPTPQLASYVVNARHVIYVSSTGVYAPGGGAVVDESWPTEPATKSGIARLAAEKELPAGATILRAAGIYGPGRGLADRLRAGTYRIVGDGRAHVSRIHVEDLCEAIVQAAKHSAAGAFNVADDDPAPIGELADQVADSLGVARPPRVPVDSVDPEIAGMLAADRRITNAKMKRELGVVLRYPTARPSPARST